MKGVAVVVAGGTGSRMRGASLPPDAGTPVSADTARTAPSADDANAASVRGTRKQYLDLGGKPLMYYALAALQASSLIDAIVVVVTPGDEAYVRTEIVKRFALSKVYAVAGGGKERYHSVYSGLCAVRDMLRGEISAAPSDGSRRGKDDQEGSCVEDVIVYIQDAARPFLTEAILRSCHDGVLRNGACVAAMPVKDTIKQADRDGLVTATPDRKTLWAMQTPQAFRFPVVYEAYEKLIAEEKGGADCSFVTDDAMVVERFFKEQRILLTEGSYRNIKVTTPEDLRYARVLAEEM